MAAAAFEGKPVAVKPAWARIGRLTKGQRPVTEFQMLDPGMRPCPAQAVPPTHDRYTTNNTADHHWTEQRNDRNHA